LPCICQRCCCRRVMLTDAPSDRPCTAGMNVADKSYINACSGIVNRGCYNPPCGGNPMDGGAQRAANFAKVLHAMKLVSSEDIAEVVAEGDTENKLDVAKQLITQAQAFVAR
jgi:hypothetical protein